MIAIDWAPAVRLCRHCGGPVPASRDRLGGRDFCCTDCGMKDYDARQRELWRRGETPGQLYRKCLTATGHEWGAPVAMPYCSSWGQGQVERACVRCGCMDWMAEAS